MNRPCPLLSIIIPHHDRPEMLRHLISTIPVRNDIEIIVVDDHSATPLPPLVYERAILLSQVTGARFAGEARNLGLRHAHGLYVLFADSDDWFDTDALNRAMEQHLRQDGVDVVYLRSTSQREDGSEGRRHLAFNSILDSAERGEHGRLVQFYPPWARFIRRAFLSEYGIEFESVRVSNDVMFSARLHFAEPVVRTSSEVCYIIREGNSSLTTNVSMDSISIRLEVLGRYNTLLATNGYKKYQVPALGQILAIAKAEPLFALKEILLVLGRGHPVFFTWRHAQKLMSRHFFRWQ